MTTPGDDDRTPPPPSSSPPPAPPDPFRHPAGGHVDQPRFGDGGRGQYAADYDGQPDPIRAAAPALGTPTRTRDSRRGLIAPIAAAIVLVGGIGLLIVSSGSDEPEVATTPRIAEVRDPDEPLVETTVPGDSIVEPTLPVQTSPPLIEPTTVPVVDPDPPVTGPSTGGPSLAQLDAALLGRNDIGSGEWTEDEPDLEDVCGEVPDEAVPDARADSLFTQIIAEPFALRQIHNALFTFPDAATAERAFTDDVDLLVACDGTTINLQGTDYSVQVNSDEFSDEQAAEAPCADQSSFLIIQLSNEDASVPYIGQSAAGFRCGRNVTVVELTTTLDLADLDDENFVDATAIANSRTGALLGS